MSQPELEFEFDPREFLREEIRPIPPSRKRAILRPVTFAGLVVVVILGVHSLYGDAKNYIASKEGTRKDAAHAVAESEVALADTKALLAKLEARANSLTERVAAIETNLYRSKATALGFRNPTIKPISLVPEKHEQLVFNYQLKKETRIELKVLQVTRDAIVFEVTGTAASSEVKSVKVAQPLKIGFSVELTQGIVMEGMPHIFITVLEMPTKDIAIIAVGVKELAQS
jgi:hypothetical protein